MDSQTLHWLLSTTAASGVNDIETLQGLWGGYGELQRIHMQGGSRDSVILKDIRFPVPQQQHPRGWSSDFAHQRKLRSYQIESHFYRHFAQRCSARCCCPRALAVREDDTGLQLLLEDLTPLFPASPERISLPQVKICLQWLAHFHATFLNVEPNGLWPQGSYWHLATRPQEWEVMADGPLKESAAELDRQLAQTEFLTIIHGDAKLDNFCFSIQRDEVAAVDFQYVGAGCGMKDVAYFFSSCLSARDCFEHADSLLDYYFQALDSALETQLNVDQRHRLQTQWRRLYSFAWADFQRFLMGWSPQHWKLNDYAGEQTKRALAQLNQAGTADD